MIEQTCRKDEHKWVIRICDECGKRESVRFDSIIRGRKRRKTDTDLCKSCSCFFKYRPSKRGSENKNWRGGINKYGYRTITIDGKKGIMEHIVIAEQSLGRDLNPDEVVHHIDLNKSNNNPTNLYVFPTNSEHYWCHQRLRLLTMTILGEKIWFNRSTKEYTLDPVEPIPCFCSFPAKKHFLAKARTYSYYRYIAGYRENGREIWRNYHIYVAEQVAKRPLLKGEVVHHIDWNALNNDPSNLCIMTREEHFRCPGSLQKCINELYKRGTFIFDSGTYYLV